MPILYQYGMKNRQNSISWCKDLWERKLSIKNHQSGIQNFIKILIFSMKLQLQIQFQEMTKNIYDAIDTDNAGTLGVDQVEIFVNSFLKGNQIEGQINTSFEDKHDQVFKILQENESGEITLDELGKWLGELLKNQVKELQIKVEQQKYQRAMDTKAGAGTTPGEVEKGNYSGM